MRAQVARLAYRGGTASAGFAYGPFVRLDATTNGKRTTGTTQEETAAIRAALAAGGSIRKVAAEFEVAPGTVQRIAADA